MKKHLAFSCIGYFFFGISVTVAAFAGKFGLGLYSTVAVVTFGIVIFITVVFTSLEKIKTFIDEHEKQ